MNNVEIIRVRFNECQLAAAVSSSSGDNVDRQTKQTNWPTSSL